MLGNKQIFLLLGLAAGAAVQAQARDFNDRDSGDPAGRQGAQPPQREALPAARPHPPMVINLSRPSSGGQNRNYPPHDQTPPKEGAKPTWGQAGRQPGSAAHPSNPSAGGYQGQAGRLDQAPAGHPDLGLLGRPAQAGAAPGMRNASVTHHHAYSVGYVRKRLQKLGVTQEPSFITERSEFVHTDRPHSSITYPDTGPDGAAVSAAVMAPRRGDNARVRAQMAMVNGADWQAKADYIGRTERQADHYYWHTEGGGTYCHYLDSSGYDWYGWYQGDRCFWARRYVGRWWWYDADFDRWNFYNDNFWWWQDPYHVGDLYCYNDGAYIPVNSQDDQIVVTQPDTVDLQAYSSPDGSRTIKVVDVSQDAFLYDNASPPAFTPIYLASGVQSVEFSNPDNGRPLEIVLELNDSSFDLFDGQGQPYSQGGSEYPSEFGTAAPDAAPDPGPSN